MLNKFGYSLILLISVISFLVALTGCSSSSGQEENISLRSAIKHALGKSFGSIYTSYMEKLTQLTAIQQRSSPYQTLEYVSNLSGLEYCTNPTELNLYHNRIMDISSLSTLTYLILGGLLIPPEIIGKN